MNIYIVRHGDAESAMVGADKERALTKDGIEIMQKAAAGWKALITNLDCIVSSPLLRAIQTANIIHKAFDVQSDVIIDQVVVSGNTSKILELANVMRKQDILFCGHEPDCSRYLADMIANSGNNLNFKKGMIAKVSFNGKARIGAGYLDFIIPVKMFK
jgi:phosphohistidine phosphatase